MLPPNDQFIFEEIKIWLRARCYQVFADTTLELISMLIKIIKNYNFYIGDIIRMHISAGAANMHNNLDVWCAVRSPHSHNRAQLCTRALRAI